MREVTDARSRCSSRGVDIAIALLALSVAVVGCGERRNAAASSETVDAIAASSAAPRSPIQTQRMKGDPCAWITRAQAEAVLGELAADPVRAQSAETPVPAADGRACLYELTGSSEAVPRIVAIQLTVDDPGIIERGIALLPTADEPLVQRLKDAERATGDSLAEGRWDYISSTPFLFNARSGRVSFALYAAGHERATALELAGRILDGIPELPFDDDYPVPPGPPGDPDPCALLTREEAEAVLGPLVVPPYRSRESTALVRRDGGSCSYYGHHHRALVVTPTYGGGRTLFRMSSGVGQTVARATEGSQAPDTLDGPWDQLAVGVDGTLTILVGDRLLALQYMTSPTDLAGAVKLARLAAVRLAASMNQ